MKMFGMTDAVKEGGGCDQCPDLALDRTASHKAQMETVNILFLELTLNIGRNLPQIKT